MQSNVWSYPEVNTTKLLLTNPTLYGPPLFPVFVKTELFTEGEFLLKMLLTVMFLIFHKAAFTAPSLKTEI